MAQGFIPLESLLAQGRSESTPIARQQGRILDFERLSKRSRAIMNALEEFEPGAWLLVAEDSLEFAASLFALWHSKCWAVLPPNTAPETLNHCAKTARGALGDKDLKIPGLPFISTRCDKVGKQNFSALDPDAKAVVIHSSGSTGEPKAIEKKLRHLSSETKTLEKLWGGLLGDCEIVSTIGHQHLYGLLFRLLWPLCAGRTFPGATLFYPEQIAQALLKPNLAFVSGPAHLKRLMDWNRTTLKKINLKAIFSSGGPLPASTGKAWADLCGKQPIEILGSSETGGIAYKCFEAGQSYWQAFDPIELACNDNGLIRLRSPFVSETGPDGWFEGGDKIELIHENRFRHLGRVDRIVKIEEKRVSISRIEALLMEHELVEKAVVMLDPAPPTNQTRQSLGVVIEPNSKSGYQPQAKAQWVKQLKQQLLRYIDPITLPRQWRFVDLMPLGPSGKPARETLARLFAPEPSHEPKPREPILLEVKQQEDQISHWIKIPTNLVYFQGHFDSVPILAGMAQLFWARPLIAELFGKGFQIIRINRLKFKKPLSPGDRVWLEIKKAGPTRAEFSIYDQQGIYSNARFEIKSQP